MEIDIFDRVRKRLATGKDFDPQMVIDLCHAYDEQIARLKATQQSVQRTGLNVPDHKHDFTNSLYCHICGQAEF